LRNADTYGNANGNTDANCYRNGDGDTNGNTLCGWTDDS
jgi:hypothetical protein